MEDKKWLIIGIIIVSILFILKIGNEIMLNILALILIFGIAFMPYIIGIAISVIIIFFIRKKIEEKNKNSKIFIYSIIIIVSIIVCTNLGYPIMQYLSEKPDKVYAEMKEINDSEQLIGLSKEQVIALLGKPRGEIDKNVYYYDAGKVTDYLFFGARDFFELIVTFDENNKVKYTSLKKAI